MAGEIRELQGEMADYNTLMDKLNTDTEVTTVLAEYSSVSEGHAVHVYLLNWQYIMLVIVLE